MFGKVISSVEISKFAETMWVAIKRSSLEKDIDEQLTTARNDYLKRLYNYCQVLPMAVIGGEEGVGDTVRMDQVYVEMDTLTPAERPDEAIGHGEQLGKFMRESNDRFPPWEWPPWRQGGVAGRSGSGKSTFVKQLAAWLAAACLGLKDPPTGWAADILPVLTNLSDLAPRLSGLNLDGLSTSHRNRRLVKALHEQWQTDVEEMPLKAKPFMKVLEAALGNGQVLMIFDGMDEATESSREQVGVGIGCHEGCLPRDQQHHRYLPRSFLRR